MIILFDFIDFDKYTILRSEKIRISFLVNSFCLSNKFFNLSKQTFYKNENFSTVFYRIGFKILEILLKYFLKRSVLLSFISDICVKRICDKSFSADPGSFVVMTRLVYLIRN